MSEPKEDLEDLICLAAAAFSLLEGYLGPQWFDAVHDLQLDGPDRVAKAAGVITARRSAMTAAEGRCPMSQIDDGGSAFPHSSQPLDAQGNPMCDERSEWGMSLRDWFAGQALAGMMVRYDEHPHNLAQCVELACNAADAMIAARLTKPE